LRLRTQSGLVIRYLTCYRTPADKAEKQHGYNNVCREQS
jgi:hypothetical protein